jgi:SAM-dependent methyltransferase
VEDLQPYQNELLRIFGMPAYQSTWLPDDVWVVMGNRGGKTMAQRGWEYAQRLSDEEKQRMSRPYSKLTASELSRVFAEQLQAGGPIQRPVETTAFGDANKSWIMPTSDPQTVETTFRVGPDGRPEAVPRLVNADVRQLPLANGSLGLAWSNLMLHWLDDPPALNAAFAELHRVLKVGGLLMFSTLGPDTLKELRAAFAKVDDLLAGG